MTQKWFSLKETAKHFGISVDTVRRWRLRGLIPSEAMIEVGGFRKYDIREIEKHLTTKRRRGRPSTPALQSLA